MSTNTLITRSIEQLSSRLRVGDVVFIRVPARPFREVADATLSWTNHVGVVVSTDAAEPLIGESTFPFSRFTRLSAFVARSEGARVAVSRLVAPLSAQQGLQLYAAAQRRTGIFYDSGFNLQSSRQFCSRYVREVLAEATGQEVGDVENFASLLSRNPQVNLRFWRWWYFGRIPWHRQTVTPASLLQCPLLFSVHDGQVSLARESAIAA